MKKILPILLVSIMMLALVAAPVSAHRGGVIEAAYGTPEIDGKFDEWEDVEFANVNVDYYLKDGVTDVAKVKMMWDEENVYWYVEAVDADGIQEKEMFEFYIDEGNHDAEKMQRDDRQHRIYLKTTEIDSSAKDEDNNDTSRPELYNGAKVVETSDGWKMEMSAKWSGLTEIEAGMVLGAEFMWDTAVNSAIRWNVDTKAGETAPYQSPKFYGDLVLLEEVVIVEEEAPATEAATTTTTSTATADPITAALAIVAILGSGVVVSKVRK